MRAAVIVSMSLVAGLSACGDNLVGPRRVGACEGVLTDVPDEPGTHVPDGSPIDWSSNPPATGPHYPIWAGWDRHYASLPRGNWMHNAEHGGVIVLYHCPAGCQGVVDQLLDVVRGAPTDPTCAPPVTRRILLAADPLLPEDVQVAAVAWDTFYTATCVDPYLSTFIAANLRHGPEDTCAEGLPAGGSLIGP